MKNVKNDVKKVEQKNPIFTGYLFNILEVNFSAKMTLKTMLKSQIGFCPVNTWSKPHFLSATYPKKPPENRSTFLTFWEAILPRFLQDTFLTSNLGNFKENFYAWRAPLSPRLPSAVKGGLTAVLIRFCGSCPPSFFDHFQCLHSLH